MINMKKIIFIAYIIFQGCIEKDVQNYNYNDVQGIWKSSAINLMFKDSLAFDVSFGPVSVFRIKGDTLLMRQIDTASNMLRPKYKILELNEDTLKLLPLKLAPYSLDKDVSYVSFVKRKDTLLNNNIRFDSLKFEGGFCPKNCSKFNIKIDANGNYKLEGKGDIQYLGNYYAELPKEEIIFINRLLGNIKLDSVRSDYTDGSVHSPVHKLNIYTEDNLYSFRIDSYDIRTPSELTNMVTYIMNTYKFYNLRKYPIY